MPRSTSTFATACLVTLAACGGGSPRLRSLAASASTGSLGVGEAPLSVDGFFGGPIDGVRDLAEPCAGYFTGPPDLVLRPATTALRVSVVAPADAALLVRDAHEAWHCAARGGTVELPSPTTDGTMRVWVGAPPPDAVVEARLVVDRL